MRVSAFWSPLPISIVWWQWPDVESEMVDRFFLDFPKLALNLPLRVLLLIWCFFGGSIKERWFNKKIFRITLKHTHTHTHVYILNTVISPYFLSDAIKQLLLFDDTFTHKHTHMTNDSIMHLEYLSDDKLYIKSKL